MNPQKIIIPNPTQQNNHQPNPILHTPRNQNQFYLTLRRYSQKLKQQRDLSLLYLNKVNQLQSLLRIKDQQIDRLSRINRQLNDKLSLYSSVLQRSQSKRPLRMSMILGNNNMTQSIIEIKQDIQSPDSIKPFQQFFIADLTEVINGKIQFRSKFNTTSNQEQIISNLFIRNCSPKWQPQLVGHSNIERKSQFVLYMANSPLTCKNPPYSKHLQLLFKINPSFYYYIPCLIQKQVASINGKLYWVSIIYGFITLLPFPDVYFRLLQQLASQLNIKNQIDQKKLYQSLTQFNKCSTQPHLQFRYLFINKLFTWKIPDLNTIDAFALIFSLGIIEQFALQLIIDVLIMLLLQIPITVVSQDQLLLCQFMFYFVYIIKPLRYPYPIVFNVNENLRDLLESPFPTFTGCVDMRVVQPYLSERAVFDLDSKVARSWPLLDHLDTSRQFLMKVVHKAGSYSRFNLVIDEIMKGHQYRELQPYWKDFSKTQIYQNYLHRL